MPDIGAILLPDPNLMDSYRQSFDKQMALKQYVAQDSRQQANEFAKTATFTPNADLLAYKGQANAMTEKIQAHQKRVQEALADRSRGGFFGLTPQMQAEISAEKYSLQQDQAQRLNAITRLTSALPTIRKAGFGSVYNQKYTEDWMAKLNKGEVPEGEPIQALPKDGSLVVNDIFKSTAKPVTIYSDPVERGNIVRGTQTTYIPDIAGDKFDKDYKTKGYQWYHDKVTSNPATVQIIADNFDVFAQNNPEEAKKLISDHGQEAPYFLHVAQHKNEIESKMLGTPQPIKPVLRQPNQGKEPKILVPESGVVDLVDKNINSTMESGKGNEINQVVLEKVDFANQKAYAIKTTPGNSLYGIQKKSESVDFPFEKAVKILKSQGYTLPETKSQPQQKTNEVAPEPKVWGQGVVTMHTYGKKK